MQFAVRACEFSRSFADARFQLLVELAQIALDPAQVGDIEHGTDNALLTAIGKANDSLVQNHVMHAAIGSGDFRLVDLQTTFGQ